MLRYLPSVNAVVEHSAVGPLIEERGRDMVLGWIREELSEIRQDLVSGEINGNRDALLNELVERLAHRAESSDQIRIGSVINATGVILHTGLGRAPLSQAAKTAVTELGGAGNLEIDLDTNRRRYRGHQLQPAWQALTGCEDSLIVNNNAAATLLTLQALGEGREVVISRGQLIEIGGSFRLPEIFALSGVILREVGTTNRTKLADYEHAIGPETAALMHVHPSNYRVIGFSHTPEIAEIAELAHAHNLAAIDDIGSGSLIDVTKYGLPAEPTFIDSINHKADVVLGSGDKLLGGPQAGIILGKRKYVEQIRNHPLARAVRVDKLTLGALSATLDSYLRNAAETEIPTVAMLAASLESLQQRAEHIRNEIGDSEQFQIALREDTAPVGGGSIPGAELPTFVLSLKHSDYSADDLARRLRLGSIRLFCRIHQDEVIIDLRSVLPEDDSKITLALRLIAERSGG
jgi:L-seryl-tRNA(Ser) seleniumtransferase